MEKEEKQLQPGWQTSEIPALASLRGACEGILSLRQTEVMSQKQTA